MASLLFTTSRAYAIRPATSIGTTEETPDLCVDSSEGVTATPQFVERIVFGGPTNPTAIELAADGRVFVAEKSGKG
jgi:hypothetical protein